MYISITIYPTLVEYIFFSIIHRIFAKKDHSLGHKRNLNKWKIIEIIHSMLYDHNEIKPEQNITGNPKQKYNRKIQILGN